MRVPAKNGMTLADTEIASGRLFVGIGLSNYNAEVTPL